MKNYNMKLTSFKQSILDHYKQRREDKNKQQLHSYALKFTIKNDNQERIIYHLNTLFFEVPELMLMKKKGKILGHYYANKPDYSKEFTCQVPLVLTEKSEESNIL